MCPKGGADPPLPVTKQSDCSLDCAFLTRATLISAMRGSRPARPPPAEPGAQEECARAAGRGGGGRGRSAVRESETSPIRRWTVVSEGHMLIGWYPGRLNLDELVTQREVRP